MVRAEELMGKHVVGISSTASISSAEKLMKSAHVSVLPVIDNGKLVGIVTKNSISGTTSSAGSRISLAMSRPVFVSRDDKIDKVIREMVDNGLQRLPVVNNPDDRLCIGIITTTDVARELKR